MIGGTAANIHTPHLHARVLPFSFSAVSPPTVPLVASAWSLLLAHHLGSTHQHAASSSVPHISCVPLTMHLSPLSHLLVDASLLCFPPSTFHSHPRRLRSPIEKKGRRHLRAAPQIFLILCTMNLRRQKTEIAFSLLTFLKCKKNVDLAPGLI